MLPFEFVKPVFILRGGGGGIFIVEGGVSVSFMDEILCSSFLVLIRVVLSTIFSHKLLYGCTLILST